jgi:hypothetical protein
MMSSRLFHMRRERSFRALLRPQLWLSTGEVVSSLGPSDLFLSLLIWPICLCLCRSGSRLLMLDLGVADVEPCVPSCRHVAVAGLWA